MKKVLVLLAVLASLIFTATVFAASTQTVTLTSFGKWKVVNVAWTAHTDGVYTTYAFSNAQNDFMQGTWLCEIVTNPGGTAPAADYDITLLNADGADVLGGGGNNRHTSNSEVSYPIVDSTSGQRGCVPMASTYSLAIANITTNSGNGEVRFILYTEPK